MINRESVYSVPEEIDGDAFWEYHQHEHTVHIMDAAPEIKKYVINRVIKTLQGEQPFFGSQNYTGFAKFWYEGIEAMNKAFKSMEDIYLPNGNSVLNDYNDQLAFCCTYLMEDFIAKDPGTKIYATKGSGMAKRIFTTSLKAGTDKDAFWKYWTEEYAPAIVKASSHGLKKYVISRVTTVAYGEQPYFAISEMWFENEAAMNKAVEAWKTIEPPGGQSALNNYESNMVGNWATIVEEYVAKDTLP